MPASQSTSKVLTTFSRVEISWLVPASRRMLRASSTFMIPPSGAKGCRTFSISRAPTYCNGTT